MTMIKENAFRKIDSLGRVSIPKSLRARLEIKEGEEVEFFTMTEDGKQYICLSTEKQVDPKYTNAVAVLEELGIEIPKELQDKINK